MIDQQGNILRVFAQGRYFDQDNADTMEKVFAEISFFNLFSQVLVRRRDDPHIDIDVFVAAYAADLALLQGPQHLCLRRQRHVADLVHEERSAARLFEFALALFDGRGEGSPLVAEQFAFDQFGGNGRAVDLNERRSGPVAFGVEPAGDEFLARAVLARDQNAGVARCDLVDQTPDVLHLLGSAYDLFRVTCRAAFRFGFCRRARRFGCLFECLPDRLHQAVYVDRFGEVVLRSVPECLDSRIDRRFRGKYDERYVALGKPRFMIRNDQIERDTFA